MPLHIQFLISAVEYHIDIVTVTGSIPVGTTKSMVLVVQWSAHCSVKAIVWDRSPSNTPYRSILGISQSGRRSLVSADAKVSATRLPPRLAFESASIWMYSKVVMQHLHTVPIASSNLATSTKYKKMPLWTNFGKVASLKQRSIICQFESDQGYQIIVDR